MAKGSALGISILVIALAGALVLQLATRDTIDVDAGDVAAAVCTEAARELKGLSGTPTSIDGALATEHRVLAILEREASALEALGSKTEVALQMGARDKRALSNEFAVMLARPDFVHLSLTLPDHPELAPPDLKEWLARVTALKDDAREQFSRAGIPSCERSLG